MGYTHDWTLRSDFAPAEWKALSAFAKRVFEHAAATREIKLAREYDTPREEPVVSATAIAFNGVEDEGCETFYFVRRVPPAESNDPNMTGYSGCKTERRPYDLAVCAVLIAARVVAGRNRIVIGSDGKPGRDKEWDDAISLYNEVASLEGQGLVDASVVEAFLSEHKNRGGEKMTAKTETSTPADKTPATPDTPATPAPQAATAAPAPQAADAAVVAANDGGEDGAPVREIPPLYVVYDDRFEALTPAGVMFYYKGVDPEGKPLTTTVSKSDPYYSVYLDLYESA